MFYQPVFQKNDLSWPQQPPTEKVQKFNMIFHDSTPKKLFSRHKNKAEFKCQYDSEVLCWGQPMSFFWKLVDKTQMCNPPEATRHRNLMKLLILLPLRAIYFRSFQCEIPCTTYKETGKILNQIWLLNFRLLWNLMGTYTRNNYRYIWSFKWFYFKDSKFIYAWTMSFGQTVEC